MELRDLDKLQRAEKLIEGIRDNIIALENVSIGRVQGNIGIVLETALQTAMDLLGEVMKQMEKEIQQKQ